MSFDTLSIIRSELDSGEKLLWSGRPKGGLLLKRSDVFMIPFSLAWGGFAFFWEMMALAMIPEDSGPFEYAFPLFGVPFVLVGIYLIVGRFFYDAYLRSRTVYALTNKRVLIIVGNTTKTVGSFQLTSLGEVSYNEKSNGSGSIIFNTGLKVIYSPDSGGNKRSQASSVSFELIESVKQVYMLYRQQLDRLSRD